MTFERAIRAGAIAAVGAVVFSACQTDQVPVVVTNRDNVVIDMPAGVRWDVTGLSVDECEHHGGEYILETDTCEGQDF